MHRIDTATAQKDKFGAGKNGFTRGNPQTGTPATDLDDDYCDMLQEELAGVVEASGVNLDKSKHNQLLTALKALLLSRAHPFADIKADGAAAVAEALSNLQLRESFSGIVGNARNIRMSIAGSSSTATLLADELIVEESNERQYRISKFSETVILTNTGAGGMDTGQVPVTGSVALYAIFNPSTKSAALLAVDCTNKVASDVYVGENLPEGYSASALVSVCRIASSQFIVCEQIGRDISTVDVLALSSTSQQPILTSLSVSGIIPPNAKGVKGWAGFESTTASNQLITISSNTSQVSTKRIQVNGALAMNASFDTQITSRQTIYYMVTTTGTIKSSSIIINGYNF